MIVKRMIDEMCKDDGFMECLEMTLQDKQIRLSVIKHRGILIEETKESIREYLKSYRPQTNMEAPAANKPFTMCEGTLIIYADIGNNKLNDIVCEIVDGGEIVFLRSAKQAGLLREEA